jgi:double-stranded uracil-DNA glycosylase
MVLPDYLKPGLDLVLCGTAPGPVSAARGHYYANPGNRFWRTLHEVGLTARLFSPDEDHLLNEIGIGLTDLVKTRSGLDRDLLNGDYDVEGLRARIAHFGPKILAFDSLNAGRRAMGRKAVTGPQPEAFGGAEVFILPSTSGLACGSWDIGPWRELAKYVGFTRQSAEKRPVSSPLRHFSRASQG